MHTVTSEMETADLENVIRSLSDDHFNGYDSVGNRRSNRNRDPVWTNERMDRQELIDAVRVLTEKVAVLETAMRIITAQVREKEHTHG